MATSVANPGASPTRAVPTDDIFSEDSPSLTSNSGARQANRFSSFDTNLFSTYTRDSPGQTRRALEAHITETDRRIQDASKLGNTLLEQRNQLNERLKDVETAQGNEEVGPELRQKLIDLEKEYNEVGRETARAFMPKARALSSEANANGTPTPSTFSAEANASPSKVRAPSSRKQRNQPSTRVKDLEFATQISTSLLNQVRHLQAILTEKEAALKSVEDDKARLESDTEHYSHRLRALDENEQKYKDDNWSLETQVQELHAAAREAASREQRLTQDLTAVKMGKDNSEKEFEDLKVNHTKLSEDHDAFKKAHDTEVSGIRRGLASSDAERDSLHRKIEELTSQNQDLARAVAYRANREPESVPQGAILDDEDLEHGNTSPEHSRPSSPTKATPRQGGLESETLKSSLHHAHRMMQNLKNNIHREKTEKNELKRMLQDARDELESRRTDGGQAVANAAKKKKAGAQELFKKPSRPEKLGGAKTASEEIVNDPHWEEYDAESPLRRHSTKASIDASTDNSDAFETANEKETSTETEAFETGAESLAGEDSDDLTETEDHATARSLPSKFPGGNRLSCQSTASEDYNGFNMRTPPSNTQQRFKVKLGRAYGHTSEADSAVDSPASFMSNRSLPNTGVNLAAELENLDDGASATTGTPSGSVIFPDAASIHRRRIANMPGSVDSTRSARYKPEMADSGVMTEPWEPTLAANDMAPEVEEAAAGGAAAGLRFGLFSKLFPVGQSAKGQSLDSSNQSSPGSRETMIRVVSPNSDAEAATGSTEPALIPFKMSSISSQNTEPVERKIPVQTPTAVPTSDQAMSPVPFTISVARPEYQTQTTPKQTVKPNFSRPARPMSPSNVENDSPALRSLKRESNDGFQEPTLQHDDPFEATRTPFNPISGNARTPAQIDRNSKLLRSSTLDEGTQTLVSADQIENLLKERKRPAAFGTTLGSFASTSPRSNQDSSSLTKSTDDTVPGSAAPRPPKRSGSAGSYRKLLTSPSLPPLPQDHKQVIAAAASKSNSSTQGSMGPPLMSAAAYKAQRDLQSTKSSGAINGAGSSRPGVRGSSKDRAPSMTGRSIGSRRSSVSSFASELDERFNIGANRGVMMPDGFEISSADPRMIQAITQTMIGEFLWKYTRKSGRSEMSEKRHKRFFWVHPYTRTLYWSDSDPSSAGSKELKAKSVAIEAVRVVSDNNPIPPGLHKKSLVVLTPGRQIKFTAHTSQQHETWFNALSYLLIRSGANPDEELQPAGSTPSYSNYSNTGDPYTGLTDQDISEFNPSSSRRRESSHNLSTRRSASASSTAHGKRTSLAPTTSLSSPRTRQSQSVARALTDNISETSLHTTGGGGGGSGPTTSSHSRLGSLSSRLGIGSLRGRSTSRDFNDDAASVATAASADDASLVSARRAGPGAGAGAGAGSIRHGGSIREDSRESSGRSRYGGGGGGAVENVRACCDGKHDVRDLAHHGVLQHGYGGFSSASFNRRNSRTGSVSSRRSGAMGGGGGSAVGRSSGNALWRGSQSSLV